MKCPSCDSDATSVVKTLSLVDDLGDPYIRRRRKCLSCGDLFSTFECYEKADLESAFRIREALALLEKVRSRLLPEKPVPRGAREAISPSTE